jgi:hypothetical protein
LLRQTTEALKDFRITKERCLIIQQMPSFRWKETGSRNKSRKRKVQTFLFVYRMPQNTNSPLQAIFQTRSKTLTSKSTIHLNATTTWISCRKIQIQIASKIHKNRQTKMSLPKIICFLCKNLQKFRNSLFIKIQLPDGMKCSIIDQLIMIVDNLFD